MVAELQGCFRYFGRPLLTLIWYCSLCFCTTRHSKQKINFQYVVVSFCKRPEQSCRPPFTDTGFLTTARQKEEEAKIKRGNKKFPAPPH